MADKKIDYNLYSLVELKKLLLEINKKDEPEKYKAVNDAKVLKEFASFSKK